MQILGLLGMYFDAAVVFVTNSSLLFRFAMAILCNVIFNIQLSNLDIHISKSPYEILRTLFEFKFDQMKVCVLLSTFSHLFSSNFNFNYRMDFICCWTLLLRLH